MASVGKKNLAKTVCDDEAAMPNRHRRSIVLSDAKIGASELLELPSNYLVFDFEHPHDLESSRPHIGRYLLAIASLANDVQGRFLLGNARPDRCTIFVRGQTFQRYEA